MASLEDPSSLYDLPRDEKARTELFVSVVNGYVESGKNRQLRIMVIGETGQGKSTLINALVGSEVAKEGDQFEAATDIIQQYSINQNGVNITIWDTPGFGMGTPKDDEKMVEKLKQSGCREVDLALFCIRMDHTRFPTRVHYDTIMKLNQVFGREFWKYCLFVLTFANNIQQFCPVGKEMTGFFSDRCFTMEEKIRGALEEFVQLKRAEIGRVRAVPVGSYKKGLFRENPWALPDREDWFIMFWLECTEHMQSSALSALLRANYHRLEAMVASETTSICPPPNFDPYDRFLQATVDEVQEVRLQMEKDKIECTNDRTNAETRQRPTGRGLSDPTDTRTQQMIPVTDNVRSVSINGGDAERGIHDREVPLFETLQRQLEDQESGFFEYLSTFAKERRKTRPVLGYLQGLLDGLKAYFRSSKPKKND